RTERYRRDSPAQDLGTRAAGSFGRTAYEEMDLPAGYVSYLSGIITVHTPLANFNRSPPPEMEAGEFTPCIHFLRERGERPTDARSLGFQIFDKSFWLMLDEASLWH